VIRAFHLRNRLQALAKSVSCDDRASQLVEFAVALPLLVVFVVGIFDFSGAYTLKQKLTNVAGDAARMAAADPSNDLKSPSAAVPVSVDDAFQMVDGYFLTGNLTDCTPSLNSTTGLTWTYTGTTNCPPGGLTIVINRGYYFPAVGATTVSANCTSPALAGQTAVIGTCVSISYAYQWKFGQAASLLGRSIVLPTTITASAVAMNED
jgi:Flp pilus assembly protein TadG